jgi:Protein of unknown function (DUF1524)
MDPSVRSVVAIDAVTPRWPAPAAEWRLAGERSRWFAWPAHEQIAAMAVSPRRRHRPLHRRRLAVVLSVLVVALVVAGVVLYRGGPGDSGVATRTTPAPALTTQPASAADTDPAGPAINSQNETAPSLAPFASEPSWQNAITAIAMLTVKGRAPKTGYDRSVFGQAWSDVDGNGCDTRDDILLRDLDTPVLQPGSICVVSSGTLDDPYTNRIISFRRGVTSGQVHIDHVVALSDAWQKGAQQWTATQSLAFANDPLNLLAVDAQANLAKGDSDAASWLPPAHDYRCPYVARQVEVKTRYDLAVTEAEKQAMLTVLSSCTGSSTTNSAPGSVAPTVVPPALSACETAYPTICLPPAGTSPDLNCSAIPQSSFTVLPPDPYHLDGNDHNGIGCES